MAATYIEEAPKKGGTGKGRFLYLRPMSDCWAR